MLSLIGSLIFGVGQVVVGAFLVVRGIRENRWRRVGAWRVGAFIATLAGAWFITSGFAELLVSGMEAAQRIGHGPSEAVFGLWRGRADTVLFVVTLVLLVVALGSVVARRMGSVVGNGRQREQ